MFLRPLSDRMKSIERYNMTQLFSFYIVTKPTHNSTLEDICFMTNASGLILQGRGGLEPEDIYGMYTEVEEAETAATALLLITKAG